MLIVLIVIACLGALVYLCRTLCLRVLEDRAAQKVEAAALGEALPGKEAPTSSMGNLFNYEGSAALPASFGAQGTSTADGGDTWEKLTDDQGQVYYWNESTGASAWELPNGARLKGQAGGLLASSSFMRNQGVNKAGAENGPGMAVTGGQQGNSWGEGWERLWDADHQSWYWYNSKTGESQWE